MRFFQLGDRISQNTKGVLFPSVNRCHLFARLQKNTQMGFYNNKNSSVLTLSILLIRMLSAITSEIARSVTATRSLSSDWTVPSMIAIDPHRYQFNTVPSTPLEILVLFAVVYIYSKSSIFTSFITKTRLKQNMQSLSSILVTLLLQMCGSRDVTSECHLINFHDYNAATFGD